MPAAFLKKLCDAAREAFAAPKSLSQDEAKTALEKASWSMDSFTVRDVITKWPQLLDHPSKDGLTALHCAAIAMDDDQIEWLIARGAHVAATDYLGNTALHYVAQTPSALGMSALIAAGAPIDAPNLQGETPLFYAVMFERTDSLKMLIDAGARDCRARHDGETPRSLAPKDDKQSLGVLPPTPRPDMLHALEHAQESRRNAFAQSHKLKNDITVKPAPTIRKRNARQP